MYKMEAVFNFKVVINDTKCAITMSQEKIDNVEITQQQALLKIFCDLNKKVDNLIKGKSKSDIEDNGQKTADANTEGQKDETENVLHYEQIKPYGDDDKGED